MLMTLALPRIGEHSGAVFVEAVHVAVGVELGVGSKLLDLRVDLSAVAAHDCPPISFYRVVLRERGWLRRLDVPVGAAVDVGNMLAVFTSGEADPLDGVATRPLRVTVAGIVRQGAWWRGGQA